jgi:hypothetical protein
VPALRKYNIKKAISMKLFISELGENFSEAVRKRLLELEVRCVLTRKDDPYKLDIKHVEHTKFDCEDNKEPNTDCKKEFSFGQFIVREGVLYYSEGSEESPTVMPSPVISHIFENLNGAGMISVDGLDAKIVDDSNIDFVVDSIIDVCPQVSEEYLKIISKYCAIDGFTKKR